MAVWQENLQRLLNQKEVLILHGNVRDTAYIKPDGTLINGLTELLRDTGKTLGFQRAVFWGVTLDHKNEAHSPVWSLERSEPLDGQGQPSIQEVGAQDRETVLLSRWLSRDIRDRTRKTLFVIHYLDKLTPYSQRGIYPRDINQLIILIQKIIKNIADNNRLIMIALDDSMIPLEYYTHSPRVALLPIPMPDRTERRTYFARYLSGRNIRADQLDLLGNITDGLYVRDLENILSAVVETQAGGVELVNAVLRRLVNRYRIGSEDDPWAQLPLTEPPKGLIDAAEAWFKQEVSGQDQAVAEVVLAIKKARAGIVGLASEQPTKPKAVFFFAGPTGVGKTFLAKKLAEYLFDTGEAFIRFDMSEFKEAHTVSKLIGAPPGYVGYEEGGKLTNAVRSRPFSVILFDEVEKAHPLILDLFLQILDDGRLTDSRGQTVFFTETVIIFTSNIGTRTADSAGKPLEEKSKLEHLKSQLDGFSTEVNADERAARVREHFIAAVQNFFVYEISRPEILNRIGNHIIAFNYMDDPAAQRRMIASVLRHIAANFRERFAHLNHSLEFAEEAMIDYLLTKYGKHISQFGGRGLVNVVDDELGRVLAEPVLLADQYGQTKVCFVVKPNAQGGLLCHR